MLGAEQRAWLIDGLTGSSASWKLWASPLMVAQMVLDLTTFETLPAAFRQPFYFKVDHWDGFRSERAQILAAVADVPDVVVLSGDLHGFYASHLHVDFDDPSASPAAVEFTVSAISSASLQEQVEKIVASEPLLTPLFAGLVEMFDDNLRTSNAHFAHVDSAGLGLMIVEASSTELRAELVSVRDVFEPEPSQWSRTRFTVARGTKQIQV
jgi:alkaline phosphatase D